MIEDSLYRCKWCVKSNIEKEYHDKEWGVPLYDERKLFEFLVLDAFQAGLSWKTVLIKRENFRKAFDNFEPSIIVNYNQEKIETLMKDASIIRNRLKIEATIINAEKYLRIKDSGLSFSDYIWSFSNGQRIINEYSSVKDITTHNDISDKMSKEMKKYGFKFVGTTICYAFMQAMGMVNDHEVDCFRYIELK
ncbi:MAG TPA: DNA-3-methyladenine glycosylase I [Candidatus Kapabacteria bacterium]|nr:DNA-3-methyladenine glycosylase I [Candidatus Kapabacteria bacterium]